MRHFLFSVLQDMVYAKKIVGDVKLTTYGRVLYTNLLASVPCGIMCKALKIRS